MNGEDGDLLPLAGDELVVVAEVPDARLELDQPGGVDRQDAPELELRRAAVLARVAGSDRRIAQVVVDVARALELEDEGLHRGEPARRGASLSASSPLRPALRSLLAILVRHLDFGRRVAEAAATA